VPAIFVTISAAFALNTLLEKPDQAGPGLMLLAVGLLVYYSLRWTRKKQ
jgi:hypothetical protein